MKKNIASLLVLVLSITLVLAACSSGNDKSNPGNTPAGEGNSSEAAKPVQVSVFAVQEPNMDWATNKFTQFAEGKFNIKFKWETTPPDGAKEKRQISLASGDYPDVYMLTHYIDQFSQADIVKFGQQGVLIPLNDLIDEYAPNIKAALEAKPDLKALTTAPDGKIYGLTAYSQCFHCSYPNKMWVNTKWLEKLNMEMPKTTDEFKEMLKAFKTKDPNGNGKADEVPLSGSIEDFGVRIIPYLMNAFVYDDDRNHLRLNNGKVESSAVTEEWKQGLAYIKSLYDEGLIDPGAFTQNAEAFKKIGENGDVQLLGAGAGMHPAIFINIDGGNKNSKDYNPLPPLTGPGGVALATHDGGGVNPGAKFAITNKASKEAQIALIKLVDYMYTPEGQTNGASGMEGIDWRKPKEGEVALGEGVTPMVAPIPAVEGEAPRNAGWSGMGHYYMPKEYRDSWVQGTDIYDSANYERRLYQATLLYQGHEPKELFPLWALWVDAADMDESSILQTNIRSYIDQSSLQFITGNKSLDKDWDAYIKGLESLKLNRYLEILQKAYDASF
ncbi:ABC transporter substrate-binding protein [Paenibacillus radicis (ex Gao et al. 2016)]|uniref:ABC transporter substrate-binding protein n=1 Tax=Paenibacillus radicis (ex Gao et al. 2016) TaxID=1737354 RepID=A0A917GRH3_9BACL|nr:ABC transporter substrate-binding protein [Paenibacillus radicis (ex Gao et al. 2016)]GGG54278.1 ABC transporter substrate-binding protein [Paenibacillus radicis (ex Gao et al. 2016)]